MEHAIGWLSGAPSLGDGSWCEAVKGMGRHRYAWAQRAHCTSDDMSVSGALRSRRGMRACATLDA